MPKVDLKLYSTDAAEGKKQTTTVTYVNPNTSNAVLKTFAQKLNAFTTNTYDSADRVETVNVDTDESRKSLRDIQITGASQGATATISLNCNEGEELNPAVFYWSQTSTTLLTVTKVASEYPTVAKFTVAIPNEVGSVYVGTRAKNGFYADFIFVNVS